MSTGADILILVAGGIALADILKPPKKGK